VQESKNLRIYRSCDSFSFEKVVGAEVEEFGNLLPRPRAFWLFPQRYFVVMVVGFAPRLNETKLCMNSCFIFSAWRLALFGCFVGADVQGGLSGTEH